jgi:hypothetical protein
MKSIRTAALLFVAVFVFAAVGYAQVPQDMRGRDRGDGTDGGGRVANPGVGSTGIGSTNTNGDRSTASISPKELSINDKLVGKLKLLLPEGTDPRVAANGFQDLKDFVATVRAANNLKVPFNELKHKMGDGSSKELQKAIHALKPDVDPKVELKKASEQAKQDIKESKQS